MKKILKFIGNIFRWYFLGIGYICYLIYFILKTILFYLGLLLSNIFYFIYSLFTLKFIREAKNKKETPNTNNIQNNISS